MYRNLMLTMFLGGLWHGAAWTFVLWGIYHGTLLVVYKIAENKFPFVKDPGNLGAGSNLLWARGHLPEQKWRVLQILIFFHLTVLGWLLFRAQSFSQITDMLQALIFRFDAGLFFSQLRGKFLLFAAPLLLIQWGQWKKDDLYFLYKQHWLIKTFIYALMTYLILGWGIMTREEFIYFQF